MPTLVRTVANELRSLMGGVMKRGEKTVGPARVTARVAADVLGTDAAQLSTRARQLARLAVAPKGEGRVLAKAAAEVKTTGQRFANNRVQGEQREAIVESLLSALFPKHEGFVVRGEQYLRDRHARIALDAATGESRRIDFAVFKGDEVVKLLEVTSEKVNKGPQLAKEARMRKHGARYMTHPETGERLRIAADVKTQVVRLP